MAKTAVRFFVRQTNGNSAHSMLLNVQTNYQFQHFLPQYSLVGTINRQTLEFVVILFPVWVKYDGLRIIFLFYSAFEM